MPVFVLTILKGQPTNIFDLKFVLSFKHILLNFKFLEINSLGIRTQGDRLTKVLDFVEIDSTRPDNKIQFIRIQNFKKL